MKKRGDEADEGLCRFAGLLPLADFVAAAAHGGHGFRAVCGAVCARRPGLDYDQACAAVRAAWPLLSATQTNNQKAK